MQPFNVLRVGNYLRIEADTPASLQLTLVSRDRVIRQGVSGVVNLRPTFSGRSATTLAHKIKCGRGVRRESNVLHEDFADRDRPFPVETSITRNMSSSEKSFSVVICHGSYHTPEPHQNFVAALRSEGIEAQCPQLPSSDLRLLDVGDISNPDYDRDPPPNGYPQPADDAKVVGEILNRLILEHDKYVLLIGHSSGAFTATMVATPELQAKSRKGKGLSGGVIGVFYACGFLVPVGESVNSFFQPKDGSEATIPPYCRVHVRISIALDNGGKSPGRQI